MSYSGPVSDAWISEEDSMATAVRRVFARARRRWPRVLVVALLATAAAMAFRVLRAPSYRGSLYFRIAEGDLVDPALTPRPPRDLRRQIASVALSRQQVELMMRKLGVSRAWLDHDPLSAVDDFRDQIEIEVTRNYFVEDRGRRDAPRSAFVTISLTGADADLTRAILHEIRDAILRDQSARGSGNLAETQAALEAELARARQRTRSLQEEIARIGLEASRAPAGAAIGLRARAAALEVEVSGAIGRVLALERRADAIAFSGAAEGEQLGLTLLPLDEDVASLAPPLGPAELALRAAAILAVASLLAAVIVGAFDDRIYAPEDLAVRGVRVFGALSRFPGDDVGPWPARAGARGAGVTP